MVQKWFVMLHLLLALSVGSCLEINFATQTAATSLSDGTLATLSDNDTQTNDYTNATAKQWPIDSLPIIFIAHSLHSLHTHYAAVAAAAASVFNEVSPVFVLTDDVEGFSDTLGNLEPCKANSDLCARVQAINLAVFQNLGPENLFKQSYIHCSILGIEHERSCFQRFFWLQEFMNNAQIGRALFLDSDILLAGNVAKVFDLNSDKPFFALSVRSTYFSYWSLGTLNGFCEYIQHFYARPLAQVAKDIEKYGRPNIRPSPPKGWPTTITPHQFSDMWILGAFLDTHPELRRFVLTDEQEQQQHLRCLTGMKQAFGTCTPDLQWQTDIVNGLSMQIPTAGASGHKLLGMHFQGKCKGQLINMYNKMVGTENPSPKLQNLIPLWNGRED